MIYGVEAIVDVQIHVSHLYPSRSWNRRQVLLLPGLMKEGYVCTVCTVCMLCINSHVCSGVAGACIHTTHAVVSGFGGETRDGEMSSHAMGSDAMHRCRRIGGIPVPVPRVDGGFVGFGDGCLVGE